MRNGLGAAGPVRSPQVRLCEWPGLPQRAMETFRTRSARRWTLSSLILGLQSLCFDFFIDGA